MSLLRVLERVPPKPQAGLFDDAEGDEDDEEEFGLNTGNFPKTRRRGPVSRHITRLSEIIEQRVELQQTKNFSVAASHQYLHEFAVHELKLHSGVGFIKPHAHVRDAYIAVMNSPPVM